MLYQDNQCRLKRKIKTRLLTGDTQRQRKMLFESLASLISQSQFEKQVLGRTASA